MKRFTLSNFMTRLGGEHHPGWLPENAAGPLPLPFRELVFDFAIEGTEGGYIFKYPSRGGEMMGDNWFEFLEDANAQAQVYFGLSPDAWVEKIPEDRFHVGWHTDHK